LKLILENTCKGFEKGNVKKYVERAMQSVQQVMSEDELYRSDIPVGLFLRRFFLLPATHFPSFLESTPDRIDELWEEARQIDSDNGDLNRTSEIANPICRSAKLLDLVENNKRLIDYRTDLVPTTTLTDLPTYSWSVADQSRQIDFDWEWAQGGDSNFYYLPVEYLPGRIDH